MYAGKTFTKSKSLISHINTVHKLLGKEYYNTYIDNSKHLCIVCNKNETEFISILLGYKKTCSVKCANKINGRYEKIAKTRKENSKLSDLVEPFEVYKDSNLKNYKYNQRFLYKCDLCKEFMFVNRNFNENLNDKNKFLCNKCKNKLRQSELYHKIQLTNERIFIDSSSDLSLYYGKQKVYFKCLNCQNTQTATIEYMRQNKRKDTKFLCKNCSTKYTVNKLYGVDYIALTFTNPKYISKQSIRFFNDLINIIKINRKFYYNENEFGIKDIDGKYYKYDFTDYDNKIIIEYNGDYWHPKRKDDPNWKNKILNCNTIWEHDQNKKICAERKGFKIFYIWEHEINECYSECLARCKSILEDNNEICTSI